MKEVFEFSLEEIAKILFEELVRTGKVEDKRCGVSTRVNFNYTKFESITVSIGDPIPGAKIL